MKNTIKIVGVIVLVAVIGFSMAGCLSLGIGSSSESSRSGSSGSGNSGNYTVAWPANDVWAGYGLSGLQPPPGDHPFSVNTFAGTYVVGVGEAKKAEYDNLVAQIRGMSGVVVYKAESTNKDGTTITFTTPAGYGVSVSLASGKDGGVMIGVTKL